MKTRAIIVAATLLATSAFGQIDTDPTEGIVHTHGNGCNWFLKPSLKGDRSLQEVPVAGKNNEWTQKRVRYMRAGTGVCWAGQHREACPCAFEDLKEVEAWYERVNKEVTYIYADTKDVKADVAGLPDAGELVLDGIVLAARTALVFTKKVKKRKVWGAWSPLPPIVKDKDICECAKNPNRPGNIPTGGGFRGYPNPARGRANDPPPATTEPNLPPPFTPREDGNLGGTDIPVKGTGPATGGFPQVDPQNLPETPLCKAGNDIPAGRFRWDYGREYEWKESITPAYHKFGPAPLCVIGEKQDRYMWIKRVTMTGTLMGAATCTAKPNGHNGHPKCAAGCNLTEYPTQYTVSWFRTLTFEPVQGTISCTTGLPIPWSAFGSTVASVTGTIGWKPKFGNWEIEVGSGTSGQASSCLCVDDDNGEGDDGDDGGDTGSDG